jgi:hypothetical protein
MGFVMIGGLITMRGQMPDAPPVEPPRVRLLKGDDDAVYQFTPAPEGNALLRHIPTWADLVALGLDGGTITVVEPAELARYALGPPLTAATAAMPTAAERDPHNSVVGFVQAQVDRQLWLGTRFAGLFACPWQAATALTAQALTTLDLTHRGFLFRFSLRSLCRLCALCVTA